MGIRPFACDRAREWLSLQLDGELSELQRMLLGAHVERCSDCRVFEADLGALTLGLRATQLEAPTHPVAVPRRRSGVPRVFEVRTTVAAAVAVAIGLAVTSSSSRSLGGVGPVFKEPAVAFDAGARGLPRASARGQDDTFPMSERSRKVALPDL